MSSADWKNSLFAHFDENELVIETESSDCPSHQEKKIFSKNLTVWEIFRRKNHYMHFLKKSRLEKIISILMNSSTKTFCMGTIHGTRQAKIIIITMNSS